MTPEEIAKMGNAALAMFDFRNEEEFSFRRELREYLDIEWRKPERREYADFLGYKILTDGKVIRPKGLD